MGEWGSGGWVSEKWESEGYLKYAVLLMPPLKTKPLFCSWLPKIKSLLECQIVAVKTTCTSAREIVLV